MTSTPRNGEASEIPYLSISQLKTHELNPLHWIINKILKIRSPGSEATEFGRRFHSQIEETLIKAGSACSKAEFLSVLSKNSIMPEVIEFLELWKQEDICNLLRSMSLGSDIEHKFEDFYLAPDIPPFMGVIDILIKEHLCIIDHKTVGNKKYALKQEDLQYDPQLILYAYYALTVVDPKADTIVVQHNQWFKKAKRDKFNIVQATLTRDHVMAQIQTVIESARALMQTYRTYCIDGIDAVENNLAACRYAFGGCPFLPICEGHITAKRFKELQKEGLTNSQIAAKALEIYLVEKVFANNPKPDKL